MAGLRSQIQYSRERQSWRGTRFSVEWFLAFPDGKISFLSHQQSDFVDKTLWRLRLHPDDIHLVIDEAMVAEVVVEKLKASGKDPMCSDQLDQIFQTSPTLASI